MSYTPWWFEMQCSVKHQFCHSGKSALQLSEGLLPHLKAELLAILQALEQQFPSVQRQLHLQLRQQWWKQWQ